jgi:hypothetical protein
MRFADPLTVKCPRCAVESRHNPSDLLALTAICPACGSSLNEVGMRMGASLDEWSAFAIWAEVLLGVEDSLGIATPGISDGEVLGSKPSSELTLRDLARLVSGHVGSGPNSDEMASRLVLEIAEQVAGRQVPPSNMDRRLLQALHVPHWADKHVRTRHCS